MRLNWRRKEINEAQETLITNRVTCFATGRETEVRQRDIFGLCRKWGEQIRKTQKKRAPSSILHETKIAYYARNMFEAARSFFRTVNVTSRNMDRLAAPTSFRKVNLTSRHIDFLAAPTCCAVNVLTSRISLT